MVYDALIREPKNLKSGMVVDEIQYSSLAINELMQLIIITISKSDAEIVITYPEG